KNFKKGLVADYRVKMTPRKLCNLCELDWPSFEFVQSPEGTLDLPAGQAVQQVVTGTPGHPDQFPHIDSWLLITQTLPPLARLHMNKQGQKKKKKKKTIFQGDPVEDPLQPPPYVPLTPQTPAQPVPDPLPDSPPPSMQFCSVKQSNQLAAAHQMAFQDTQGPQQVKKDGSPFSTTDLLNWKHHNPAYSDKPQATKPNWDFNTRQGQETLGRYHDTVLHGLRAGAKKPTNMSKITMIIQKRLYEAFWTYTPFDPERAKNQRMINVAFVAQSCADPQQKLQKLEGFSGMNATQLLEVANNVFVNQDREAQ
ncbi:hypothetical protein FD755_017302, partial [Muntiacus reevesi]